MHVNDRIAQKIMHACFCLVIPLIEIINIISMIPLTCILGSRSIYPRIQCFHSIDIGILDC